MMPQLLHRTVESRDVGCGFSLQNCIDAIITPMARTHNI